MRQLDEEEQELMRRLEGVLPTNELIVIVRDLAETLRSEGLVIRAKVANLAAARLDSLAHHRQR